MIGNIKKIVHIASFKGNLGDIINHEGFYKSFNWLFEGADVKKVEIRDFYKSSPRRLFFDLEFAKVLNSFDLIVFGGGGFFDANWEWSETGTTLDFSDEFIDIIDKPVLVNAMGYHEYQNIHNECIYYKFDKFLSKIEKKGNWFISVRNDGSIERLKRYGQLGAVEVPDNGLIYEPKRKKKVSNKNYNVIGFCITNDLFCDEFNGSISTDYFNTEMSELIDKICNEGNRVILFPHIPSDIHIISEILRSVGSTFQRELISVAPFSANNSGDIEIMSSYYQKCDLIVGMRFHSLILSIINDCPCIALAGHAQIEDFFSGLGLERYCIRVKEGFNWGMVYELINQNEIIHEEKELIRKIKKDCARDNMLYQDQVKSFLSKFE